MQSTVGIIRPAQKSDCSALTNLALQSKSVWGYSEAFIRDCEAVLTVTPEMIKQRHHGVVDVEDEIAGFYFLMAEALQAELELLYIAPHFIGQGIGKILFQAAEKRALELGCQSLRIEADPNAVGFYNRMGARQTGWCRSEVEDVRELPLMMKKLRPR